MRRMPDPQDKPPKDAPADSDWGVAACSQAQADGVPCAEMGRYCEICPEARHNLSGTAANSSAETVAGPPGAKDTDVQEDTP